MHKSDKIWDSSALPDYAEEHCRLMATELNIPLSIVRILSQRGIKDRKQIEDFLIPSLSQLPSPFKMKGMDKAVAIICEALMNNIPITIYGDYDVDGITSTAILTLFFKSLGSNPTYYQPDRISEGYGLNIEALKKLSIQGINKQGRGVLITVDCGISNLEEVNIAKQLGFSVIITDHHRVPEELPSADAIINPLQAGCEFPFKQLAGVGVAFYFTMGIRSHLYRKGFWQSDTMPNLKCNLDLVALGTISDMVPLLGINRIFVRTGLEVLESRFRPGIRSLVAASGIKSKKITTEDIAYRIGPRINALGRMGKADKAVDLFLTERDDVAWSLTDELEHANEDRKNYQYALFEEVAEIVRENLENDERNSLVIFGNNWHIGVIGIVAAQISDLFLRPTIILSSYRGEIKGSGRSIPGINIYEALKECDALLDKFGGHAGAVGMSIKESNIIAFQKRFEKVISEMSINNDFVPKISVDLFTSVDELYNEKFLEYFSRLSPFGIGNPEPIFVCRKIKLSNPKVVGEKHLKFSLSENGSMRHGIGFNFGHLYEKCNGRFFDFAFNLRQNHFKGSANWELNLVDVHEPHS